MKNLGKISWFGIGIILSAASFFTARKIKKKEKKEHKLILDQLKLNEDIMKVENPEKTGIRFIKHPKSKKLTADGEIRWEIRVDGLMMVQLDDKQSIVPFNKNGQFNYYFHEKGHLKNKNNGHFEKETICGYNPDHCLRTELEAELNVIEASKKIGKKLEKAYWSGNLGFLWKQCEKCLKIINERTCPKEEREKIKECLNLITRSIDFQEYKLSGEKND